VKYLARLLLVLGGVAAALAVGEIVVRVSAMAPRVTELAIDTPNGMFLRVEDPDLKYVPKPGSRGISAYGIRDRDYTLAKPPRTFRIVVIGDSVTFGMCNQHESVPLERTFVKRMEAQLNASPHPGVDAVEVLNLGVPGYDTLNEAAFFRRKGAPLSPDLVVVGYVLNDNYESSAELLEFRKDPNWFEPAPVLRQLFMHSDLVRFSWQQIAKFEHRRPDWQRATVAEVPRSDHVARGFAQLSEMATAGGFKVLVAVFPVFYGENWRPRPDIFDNYPRRNEHAVPAAEAAKHGFLHIDLLDAFRRAAAGDARRLQGGCNAEHPNAAGHDVAATALVGYLQRSHLVGH
jgi:hypothetical protein